MDTTALIYRHIENVYKKKNFTYGDLEDLVLHGIKIGLNEQIQHGASSLWHKCTWGCACEFCEKQPIYDDIKEHLANLVFWSISDDISKNGSFHVSGSRSSKGDKISKESEVKYNIVVKKTIQKTSPNLLDITFSFAHGLATTTILRSMPTEFTVQIDVGHVGGKKTLTKKNISKVNLKEISYLTDEQFAEIDVDVLRNFELALPGSYTA